MILRRTFYCQASWTMLFAERRSETYNMSVCTLKIHVQPRASKNEVLGLSEDVLRIRVTAPPEAGRANEAMITLIAESLGVPKSRIKLFKGRASRNKSIVIEGLTQDGLCQRLGVAKPGNGVPREARIKNEL